MIRRIRPTLFIVMLFVLSQLDGMAQTEVLRFPYKLNFDGTTKPAVIEENFSYTDASTRYSARGVELTKAGSQFGGIGLTGVQFNSTNGIEVEFDYAMYGGTPFGVKYGDGISMFLYDAAKSLRMGAVGANLGYSFNSNTDGLDGAYLGIGLDQFGNFKNQMNGTTGVDPKPAGGWEFDEASHVTLRAGMNGGRRKGYPVLWTLATRAATVTNSNKVGRILNSDGSYGNLQGLSQSNEFTIRPGTSSGGAIIYQRVLISLVPHTSGGFVITITVKHAGGTTTVYNKYHLSAAEFNYKNSSGSTEKMKALAPSAFKIGFGASTGGASQIQLIRNLEVRIPYLPEMREDVGSFCTSYGQKSTIVMPFENDKVYNGKIAENPTSGNSSAFIDYGSFRFETASGTVLHANSYTQPNVGTWTYSSSTGQIEFTPVAGYIGNAEIYYSVKGLGAGGGPFGQDIYRSISTKVSVNVINCGSITNPNLPSGQGNKLKR